MDTKEYTSEVTKAQSTNTARLEKDGTLVITISGNQDAQSINDIDKQSLKLIAKLNHKPNVLIDATYAGFPDASARKVVIDSFNRNDYNAQAIFGFNEALRVIIVLILGRVLLRDKTKLFKTEEQARAWLAKNPPQKQP